MKYLTIINSDFHRDDFRKLELFYYIKCDDKCAAEQTFFLSCSTGQIVKFAHFDLFPTGVVTQPACLFSMI